MRRIPRSVWLLIAVMLVIIVPYLCCEEIINGWLTAMVENAQGHRKTLMVLLFSALAVDIFLPVPSSIVSTLCGTSLGLHCGFWISFMGMNVSCAAGYVFGRCNAGRSEQLIGTEEMAMLRRAERHCGGLLLVAMRAVPVLAEASVLFAGLTRMPIKIGAFWMVMGNAAVSFAYALAGAYGQSSGAVYPAFLASLAAAGLLMLAARLLSRRSTPVPAANKHESS